MPNSQKEFLSLYGWDDFYASQHPSLESSTLIPGRLICEERSLYHVQTTPEHSLLASVSGKFQFNASGRVDYPAVGDWVFIKPSQEGDRGVIHKIAPRKTVIYRKKAGLTANMQILSANVDMVFITTSANEDLNVRRIERYLTVARESGAQPVILLTKSDLKADRIYELVARMEREFPNTAVHTLSQDRFAEASFLTNYLKKGTTSVFLGSSGVGKSTLINFLIGSDLIKTQSAREHDARGRHTTTSRNLYMSCYGGMVIDTPGMRELQLSDHAEGVSAQFSDIELLISQCHYSDCHHQSEPNCAVRTALEDGSLDAGKWKGHQKLVAEVRHELRKRDKIIQAQDKKIWKMRSLQIRHNLRKKREPE